MGSKFDVDKSIEGLNATITIEDNGINNGEIYYKLVNANSEYWEKANGLTINIIKSGRYQFKLIDSAGNESNTKELSIALTNAPKIEDGNIKVIYNTQTNSFDPATDEQYKYDYSSLIPGNTNQEDNSKKWAYLKDSTEEIYYLWIPRFCYNPEDATEIKFLKGTTNVSTDNTNIPEGWTIPPTFTADGNKTGVWIEISPTDISTLNLINLINQ